MAQSEGPSGPPSPSGLDRREFMLRVAALGLSATAVAALAQSYERVASPARVSAASGPPPHQPFRPSVSSSQPAASPPPPFPNTLEARIGHLLRRAGFSGSREETTQLVKMGLPAAVDYLIEYDDVSNAALYFRLSTILGLDMDKPRDLIRWWLVRMVHTRRPLQEKMVLFWHGLLTSGISKVGKGLPMANQNQLFRQYALASYDVLLKAIARDPAMLVYLDSRSNHKEAPNENFARELMELFTMGPGNYTETDVRQSARAFTGWGLGGGDFVFQRAQHDFGNKTFLGRTGPFDGDDIIDIILEQPATSRFMARKLLEFFVYPNPGPETVEKFSRTFRDSRYSIKAVVRQILTSDEFFSDQAYRAKVKSPVELVAGAFRTLGIETDGRGLDALTVSMGQTLFDPPNVAGWPGGAAWLNSSTLLTRINFASRAAQGITQFLRSQAGDSPSSSTDMNARVEAMAGLLLDGNLAPGEKSVLVDFASQMAATGTGTAGRRAADAMGAVAYLLMASPEHQLA